MAAHALLIYEDAVEVLKTTTLSAPSVETTKELLPVLFAHYTRVTEAKSLPLEGVTLEQLDTVEGQLWNTVENFLEAISGGPPDLKIEDIYYTESNFVGKGSFGKVYKGTLCGTEVAIKKPKREHLQLDAFFEEVKVMKRIFHPNLVMLIGACINPDHVVIVSELMEMDLEKKIFSPDYTKLTEPQRVNIAKDIALGLNWLHGINITHRDLKLGNILVDKHGRAKIGDFGLSTIKKPTEEYFRDEGSPKGNVKYMAPEVMQLKNFDHRADIYSFGLLCLEILKGLVWSPPKGYDRKDTYMKYICDLNKRPEIPPELPEKLVNIITCCWSENPNNRPTLKHVINSLNDYLVDAKIKNPKAREFWKEHFCNSNAGQLDETVKTDHFIKLLSRSLKLPDYLLIGLRAILSWDWTQEEPRKFESKTISIYKFNTAVEMFGCFFIYGNDKILHEMSKWIRNDWFHGDIDSDQANVRLLNRKKGFFLLRLSTTLSGYPFTIMLVDKDGKILYIRIALSLTTNEDGCSVRYSSQFSKTDPPIVHSSLEDAIKNSGFKLKYPCPRAKLVIVY